jgi:hypothetical protein
MVLRPSILATKSVQQGASRFLSVPLCPLAYGSLHTLLPWSGDEVVSIDVIQELVQRDDPFRIALLPGA